MGFYNISLCKSGAVYGSHDTRAARFTRYWSAYSIDFHFLQHFKMWNEIALPISNRLYLNSGSALILKKGWPGLIMIRAICVYCESDDDHPCHPHHVVAPTYSSLSYPDISVQPPTLTEDGNIFILHCSPCFCIRSSQHHHCHNYQFLAFLHCRYSNLRGIKAKQPFCPNSVVETV